MALTCCAASHRQPHSPDRLHKTTRMFSNLILEAMLLRCYGGDSRGAPPKAEQSEPVPPPTITDTAWWVENGKDYQKIVQTITKNNAVSTDSAGFGYTPLHYCAVYCTEAASIDHIINSGADPNTPDQMGATPLKWAASYNEKSPKAVIEALVRGGADVNAAGDQWGHTALMLAAVRGHIGAAKALIAAGADVNARDSEGKSAYDRAQEWANVEMQSVLERNGAERATEGQKPQTSGKKEASVTDATWWAANGANLASVKLEVTSANAKNTDGLGFGYTPMHYCAVYCTSGAAITHIAGVGGSAVARDKANATPLDWAVTYNSAAPHEIVKALVQAGADVNLPNEELGHTPLMLAAVRNHEEVAEVLLENGADVNAKDKEGKTAYDRAREWGGVGSAPMLAVLKKHGADTSKYNDESTSAPNGMDKDANAKSSEAANWWSKNGHSPDRVKQRMQEVRHDDRDEYGATPLHWAAVYARDKDALVAVLESGADVHAKNSAGQTPIMLAALWNKYNGPMVIHTLKANLSRLDDVDDYGYTALMYAARWGHKNNVQTLLELGADPTIRSVGESFNARDFASQGGHRGVIRLLDPYERNDEL